MTIPLLLAGYRGPYVAPAPPRRPIAAARRCALCAASCSQPIFYGGVAHCSAACVERAVAVRRTRFVRPYAVDDGARRGMRVLARALGAS